MADNNQWNISMCAIDYYIWWRGLKWIITTYASIVPFYPDKEEYTAYLCGALNYYLIANEIIDGAKKCAILMPGCGPLAYKIIRSLVNTETRNT